MDNYLDELKQAGILLQNGKYIDCSIKCGKIIEFFLKALLRRYADERKFHVPSPYNSKSIDRLSLGDIFHLIDNDTFLKILSQEYKLNKNAIRSYFNKIIVTIRNDATHTLNDDGKVEAKAGAFIIYGHLLFFQKVFSKIRQPEKVVIIKDIIKPGDISVMRPYRGLGEPKETITVYKNKSSGRFFLFVARQTGQTAIMVNTEARALTLDLTNFTGPEEKSIDELKKDNLITNDMLTSYYNHIRKEKEVQELSRLSGTIITPDQIFEYRIHEAVAKMVLGKQGTYTILKGSTAVREEKGSIPESAKNIRRDLIRSGKLTIDLNRNVYIFHDDVDFRSPGAASCVISASSTNGLICFKDHKNGKTLKEVFSSKY